MPSEMRVASYAGISRPFLRRDIGHRPWTIGWPAATYTTLGRAVPGLPVGCLITGTGITLVVHRHCTSAVESINVSFLFFFPSPFLPLFILCHVVGSLGI